MADVLTELRGLRLKYKCPIIFPGDLFDKWNSSARLINWIIGTIHSFFPHKNGLTERPLYSVAGNHDLPYHDLGSIGNSAYWTLVHANCIQHIHTSMVVNHLPPYLHVHGFSHGQSYNDYRVRKHDPKKEFHLAVVHDYCWMAGHSFPGSPDDKHVDSHVDKLTANGFDGAVFGDNHKGFTYSLKGFNLANPGTMLCRTSDERDYKPFVVLLLKDGSMVQHYLNVSHDKWNDKKEAVASMEDNKDFLKELAKLGDSALDFGDAVKRFMSSHDTPVSVRKLILEYLEGK